MCHVTHNSFSYVNPVQSAYLILVNGKGICNEIFLSQHFLSQHFPSDFYLSLVAAR